MQYNVAMKKGNREMCKWTRRLNNFLVEGVLFVLLATASVASALDVGDKAPDFKLPSTNGVLRVLRSGICSNLSREPNGQEGRLQTV
jgi:hypothetical protein